MSMLSVLIKDLVEKTTPEDGTYLVAGNTDANKITFLNLVNAIKKKLGLDSAIKYVDYSVTLESNAYVTPFSHYLNKYLPTSDIEKYGIPIAATLVTSSGQANPVSLSLSHTGQYHYTAVATDGSGVMTVVYLKL